MHPVLNKLLALLLLALMLPSPALAKKKRPAPVPADAALKQALDDQTDAVLQCAAPLASAPGATVDISAKITLNNRAQILECEITLTKPSPDIQKCIEDTLRAAHFPTSKAPLVTVTRTWRISSQLAPQ